MLRRLRQLKLSLATKCQLLFGTAAGVVILAALGVTWQRIEQLTDQQNEIAAATLAKQHLAAHVATGDAATRPATSPTTSPADGDVEAPVAFDTYDGLDVRRPRLVAADADPQLLTQFERQALEAFADAPARGRYVRSFEAVDAGGAVRDGLRMAVAARMGESCLPCHADAATDGDRPPALLGLVGVEVPSQISTRQQLLNRVFLVFAAVASALVAALAFYFILTRLILTPVRVLQDAAEAVREGDLDVRAELPTGDEFEALATTLNRMVAGLQQRTEQLARANKSLDGRLGQLAEANVALDESNRLKGEFLANVSHELRTPLNSILGFADLVKSAAADNAKVARYAGNIHKSGSALLDLINDLLDLAKIEAGKLQIKRGEFSVGDVLEALSTLLSPQAMAKKARIVTSAAPGVPILQSDAGKVQQILYNLLSNAIKFSPEGGRVDVVCRPDAASDGPAANVRFSVTDQGPGIAPADHERIFEKFQQLDSSVTRQHAGTGLGLAISRELAQLLGGTLTVDSKLGSGATFVLRIPTHAPEAAKTRSS